MLFSAKDIDKSVKEENIESVRHLSCFCWVLLKPPPTDPPTTTHRPIDWVSSIFV